MNITVKKLLHYLKSPEYRVLVKAGNGYYDNLSDEQFLYKVFRPRLGYDLNLENPKTFNEKIQWLKLHNRNPIDTLIVDKYLVKDYVAEKIGEQYIIPTIGVWKTADEIDFDTLPNQFVLKCNHNSGKGMLICTDKSKLNYNTVRINIHKGLEEDYYKTGREWPYKNVQRKIIAEKFMVDESGVELKDYKIFCFNGEPAYIQVDFGRFTKHERNLYDINWNYMGFASLYPTNKDKIIEKPVCLEEMLRIAKILSEGFPFLRVDLYVINENIYFGEMTLFHGSGFEPFSPAEWDLKLGEMLNLEGINND